MMLFLILILAFINHASNAFEPTWESLRTRVSPKWYDESKIGIFIHWGVFSVPGYGSEWFWYNWMHDTRSTENTYMKNNYPPKYTYAEFASKFTTEFYDPDQWAELFNASGAKYVVLTSKHHEGYTMWPSKYSFNWNSMDVGPKRDLVGDLAKSIRGKTKLHFGLYHSQFEWYNPLYLYDQQQGHKTQLYVDDKLLPELYEIVNNYKPDVVWSDGSGSGNETYWKARQFIAWLYNESPVKDTVVVNDRWGIGVECKVGDFYTCADRYNPHTIIAHKWENCFTVDSKSWGYRRNAEMKDYLSIHQIIATIAETVSCNGNVLINVGPTSDGKIPPIQEERLRQLGDWLKVNGEAIYGTTYWKRPNDTLTKNVWFTHKPNEVDSPLYAIVLEWPANNQLQLASITANANTIVRMLGVSEPLKWHNSGTATVVEFPLLPPNKLPSEVAWTLKFTKL